MKAVINEKETHKQPEYPCLKISKLGNIVLFTEPETGVRVSTDANYNIGYFSRSWDMSEFTPFTGSITLSND